MTQLRATRLARVEITVSALGPAEAFYMGALGFSPVGRALTPRPDILGASRVTQSTLQRGEQILVLQEFATPGRPYPANGTAADLFFQHIALPTTHIAEAMDRLFAFHPAPITRGPPQQLPQQSGGAIAYKFRDPDGHPLELIQFADRKAGGIDHSAISVADSGRSIAFYTGVLGLALTSRQRNHGPEQNALDGLGEAVVDVVALNPPQATPHVELLAYHPPGREVCWAAPSDIAATRLVFTVPGLDSACLRHDPDGHALLLEPA